MLKILPYSSTSNSVRNLMTALDGRATMLKPSTIYDGEDFVLNWGNTKAQVHPKVRILNHPLNIKLAANKLLALQIMKETGVPVCEFTTDYNTAKLWSQEGNKIVVKHKLKSSGGKATHIIEVPEMLPPEVPIYMKYFNKDREFRVHTFCGHVIDFTEKKRKSETEAFNPYIRNYDNGWVFCRTGVERIGVVEDAALKAVKSLGLHFGAVDIIMKGDTVKVLEVNTAPGIEGSTLDQYVVALEEMRLV